MSETTAFEFEDLIQNILDQLAEGNEINTDFLPTGIRKVRSFADSQLLTDNHGVVVTTDDGSEFQVSIVQSR